MGGASQQQDAAAVLPAQAGPQPVPNPSATVITEGSALQGSLGGINVDQVRLEQQAEVEVSERPSPRSEAELKYITEAFRQLVLQDKKAAAEYIKTVDLVPEDLEKLIANRDVQRALNAVLHDHLTKKMPDAPVSQSATDQTASIEDLMQQGVIRERQVHCTAIVLVADRLFKSGRDLGNEDKAAVAVMALAEMGELAAFPARSQDGKIENISASGDTLRRLQVEALGIAGLSLNRYQFQDLIGRIAGERPTDFGGMQEFVQAHGLELGLVGGSHALASKTFAKELLLTTALARFGEDPTPSGATKLIGAVSHYGLNLKGIEDRVIRELIQSPSDADKKATLEVLTSKEAKVAGLAIDNSTIVLTATEVIGEIYNSAKNLTQSERGRVENIRKSFIGGREIGAGR